MKRKPRTIVFFLCVMLALSASVLEMFAAAATTQANSEPQQQPPKAGHRAKLPKQRVIDLGPIARDPETGELRKKIAPEKNDEVSRLNSELHVRAAIRSHVNLIQVGCSAVDPDGKPIRGLRAEDFRILEDGVIQNIAHFDAATEPASIVLLIDASPSVYRELREMRAAARSLAASLAPRDQVAVVAFARQTHVLLPLTRDRELLERALASPELARVANESTSNIYQAVYLAVRDLFSGHTGRKAILLLTDGQDSGLGLGWDASTSIQRAAETAGRLTFEDILRELSSAGIELYAISTEPHPKAMTAQWFAAHQSAPIVTASTRKLAVPLYTAYLAEMVRRIGGQIHFLREVGTLGGVYRKIAETLREQYVLGYYPSSGLAKPGWRSLRVELPGRPAQVAHRPAYYVSAEP